MLIKTPISPRLQQEKEDLSKVQGKRRQMKSSGMLLEVKWIIMPIRIAWVKIVDQSHLRQKSVALHHFSLNIPKLQMFLLVQVLLPTP
jgi:hypothetical protein